MITVFIPTYNKDAYVADAVKTAIHAAKSAGNIKLDVIIVDDASTDGTANVIHALEKKYPFVRSVIRKKNRGLGAGFRDAVSMAKYPKFIMIPGDNDAAPKLVTKLMHYKDKADMVIAFYLNTEMRGRWRTFLSTLYGIIYMLTFDVHVQYFNGIGIYPTDKLKQIYLHSNRFAITAEINTKLLKSGCTVYEVPGFMQTGTENSGALSLRNLMEVIQTYLWLVYEMKVSRRMEFNKNFKRIADDSYHE